MFECAKPQSKEHLKRLRLKHKPPRGKVSYVRQGSVSLSGLKVLDKNEVSRADVRLEEGNKASKRETPQLEK